MPKKTKRKKNLKPVLLLTYFAILTGSVFWSLRIATLHYGQARVEQGFEMGFGQARKACEQQQTLYEST